MSLGLLGALVAAGMCGPLLYLPKRLRLPIAVGEILVGTLLGNSGFAVIPVKDPTLTMLASIGFALLMLAAGSHVDYRSFLHVAVIKKTGLILLLNFIAAAIVGFTISKITHFDNWRLFAVISFSSSAAFVVPIVVNFNPAQSTGVLLAQVTAADAIAFLALPFVTQRTGHMKAMIGALIILVIAVLLFLLLRMANSRGWIQRAHEISKAHSLALELRISLSVLLLVVALATKFHASTMVAGFSLGIVLATIGVPHRLARQLFAVSEGFFAPLFFIWLGASINIRFSALNRYTFALTALLCIGAFLVHTPALLLKEPGKHVLLASAQLGIPAAAVTLASQNNLITPAQGGAIMLSAIGTLLLPSLLVRPTIPEVTHE